MKTIFFVLTVALLSNPSMPTMSSAAPNIAEAPFHCVTNFAKKMSSIVSYETVIDKKEISPEGSSRRDRLRLTESDRGQKIQIIYLNEGSTGIKNNGMKATFEEGKDISIVYGESKGIGGLFGSIAKGVGPTTLKSTDGMAVNDEIFTINRAGFRFMSQMILKGVEKSEGKLEGKIEGSECKLKWIPAASDYETVQISEGQNIWKLEEDHTTLASLIQRKNKDLFSKNSDLFKVRGTKKILVPKTFNAFSVVLDSTTFLPKSFHLSWEGKVIGEYSFSETKVLQESVP